MADPFLGEIRIFPFHYAPDGWALCDGARMEANQHPALFSLLGNTYGGDLRTYFHLPDLRGLATVGAGTGSDGTVSREVGLGKVTGTAQVELTTDQMPSHSHQAQGHQALGTGLPGPSATAYISIPRTGTTVYDAWTPHLPGSPTATELSPLSVGVAGGTSMGTVAGHENASPYMALNFCICIAGIYPARD